MASTCHEFACNRWSQEAISTVTVLLRCDFSRLTLFRPRSAAVTAQPAAVFRLFGRRPRQPDVQGTTAREKQVRGLSKPI